MSALVAPGMAANVPLAPRTTLGVGGAARWLATATTEAEVVAAIAWAKERDLPLFVLGGGSNLLVADQGFDGLVVRVQVRGVADSVDGAQVLVDAGAGEVWDELCAHAVRRGWAGIECLSGIPGDVGATPIQNVGAYGQEVAETIVRVRAIDRARAEIVELSGEACAFGYRDSVFKREAKDRYVITHVRLALRPGGAASVRYGELAARVSADASLAHVRDTVIALRRGKSMVLDPDAENGRSAGSFFMNPTVSRELASAVLERARGLGVTDSMPEFPAGSQVKLSAAWLIERAGFSKGTGEGRVGISTKHSLAIVNRGGASAGEVLAFARRVRAGVLERFGVALVPEPVMVGFAEGELDGLV